MQAPKSELISIDRYIYDPRYCLGQGSFGKVFKATDTSTNKEVALKVMDVRSYTSDDYLKNLVKSEIQIMKNLNHPNIVSLIDFFQSSKNLYMVTEYCQGGDLKDYMSRKRLEEKEAFSILSQILAGFKELNRLGIVHRDLKPANILIHQGIFKIADFGFAKFVNNKSEVLTSAIGTPLYMSPQILAGRNYTCKCDVWSLGIIFYELLNDITPWIGGSEKELLHNITKYKNIQHLIKRKSDKTKEILTKTLAYEEKDRCSWDELANIIEKKEKIQLIKLGPNFEENKQEIIDKDLSDIEKAELNILLKGTIETKKLLNFLHFVSLEIFQNYSFFSNISGKNYYFEKLIILLAQLIRCQCKELIRNINAGKYKPNQNSPTFKNIDKIFQQLRNDNKYYDILYQEIVDKQTKNDFLSNIKDEKEIQSIIMGEVGEKERSKLVNCFLKNCSNFVKEIYECIYEKKNEFVQNRDILKIVDYIIDVMTSFNKISKNQTIDYQYIHESKSIHEGNKDYLEFLILKYQKLLLII